MMMFKTTLVAAVVTLLGSTLALPHQQEVKLAIRDIGVVGVRSIPAQVPEIVVRGQHARCTVVEERQIAEEDPVKTDDSGNIVHYDKRQEIAVEVAVKSDNGVITPYGKRNIPVEIAVKSDGGDPVAYPKRAGIPVEIAVKSDGGDPVAYPKRAGIPAEIAVKSNGGDPVAYPKRAEIPAEVATKSDQGVISLY